MEFQRKIISFLVMAMAHLTQVRLVPGGPGLGDLILHIIGAGLNLIKYSRRTCPIEKRSYRCFKYTKKSGLSPGSYK